MAHKECRYCIESKKCTHMHTTHSLSHVSTSQPSRQEGVSAEQLQAWRRAVAGRGGGAITASREKHTLTKRQEGPTPDRRAALTAVVGREVPCQCNGLQTTASEENRHWRRGRWAALARALLWLPVARALVQRGQAPWSDLPGARAAGAATAVDGRRASQARDTGRGHRRRTRCTAGGPWAACRRDGREPLRPTAS